MLNITNVTAPPSEKVEDQELECGPVLFIFYVGIFGPIVIFGIIGNTLSFIVLSWEKHNRVATFLLQCLALTDSLFLLISGICQIFPAMTIYLQALSIKRMIQPYIQVIFWPFVHITQFLTVWMTVLVAFNR